MTFAQALQHACLMAAQALGKDVKKISWLMSNQPKADHAEGKQRKAA